MWRYQKHKKYPIVGTRMTYAIIGYPSAAEQMAIRVELTARTSGRFGRFLLQLPRTAEASLVRTIP
jgi:hypothetical protein